MDDEAGILTPQTDFSMPYSVIVQPNGAVHLDINGEIIEITSQFYHPQEAGGPQNPRNPFGPDIPGSAETSWLTTTGNASGLEYVQGQGDHYTIFRAVDQSSGNIEMTDYFLNNTVSDIGIPFYTEIKPQNPSILKEHFLGGRRNEERKVIFNQYPNPTIFMATEDFGIGIVIEDDVFRTQGHAEFDSANKLISLGNDFLGLAGGVTTSLRWTIYVLNTTNYYDFINTVRDDMNLTKHLMKHLLL